MPDRNTRTGKAGDAVTLPLNCPICNKRVEAQFTKWVTNGPTQVQAWTCPHCRKASKFKSPGHLAWVRPAD